MTYEELIEKALKGRPVLQLAKLLNMAPKTLDRYVNAERIPNLDAAIKLIIEAGVDPHEGLAVFAKAAQEHKVKLQGGFVQTDLLLLLATCGLSAIVYIMSNEESEPYQFVILIFPLRSHPAWHV